MLAGTVMVGGVMSVNVTVTVNVAEPTFPALSVALHVMVVVPTAKLVPDAMSHVGPLATLTLSVAVTSEYVTVVPEGVDAAIIMSEGTVTVGGYIGAIVPHKSPPNVYDPESQVLPVAVFPLTV